MPHSLTHPERLTITGPQGETYQGGDQEWYRIRFFGDLEALPPELRTLCLETEETGAADEPAVDPDGKTVPVLPAEEHEGETVAILPEEAPEDPETNE